MEISPRPSGFDTGLTVPAGQQLSLKVEGIISYGGPKPKCFRSVTGVTLKIRLERLESHNSAASGQLDLWRIGR